MKGFWLNFLVVFFSCCVLLTAVHALDDPTNPPDDPAHVDPLCDSGCSAFTAPNCGGAYNCNKTHGACSTATCSGCGSYYNCHCFYNGCF